MKIVETNLLNPKQIKQITALLKECFQYEGLQNEAFLSNEINFNQALSCFYLGYEQEKLVAFLTTFMPQSHEAEIIAYTHPSYRKQGRFTKLFQAALSVLKPAGIQQVLFMVEPISKDGMQMLNQRQDIRLSHSEYRMKHTNKTDIPSFNDLVFVKVSTLQQEESFKLTNQIFKMSELENRNFIQNAIALKDRALYLAYYQNKPIGTFHLHFENKTAFLYGVGIAPAMQGNGFGKQLLAFALKTAYQKASSVILDVDSNNPIAFSLYRKYGFEITFQVDYYCLSIA